MSNRNGLSRRELMRLSGGALLAAGLWPDTAWAADAGEAAAGRAEDFTFLCVNDLHFFDHRCIPFFEQMIRQMKATEPKPDFCLVVGDFAEDGTADQLGAMRDLLKTLGMPTYNVIGNHDYVTLDDRKPFEQLFPDAFNYTFGHRGWQFVALDTTQGRRATNTVVADSTLDWLKEHAPKLDRKRPSVLFTHFPLGFLVPGRPRNADAVLEPFKDLNLQAVFNGHFHGLTERHRWNATLTTDKCCSFHHANHDGTKEKGYFVCTAKEGKIGRTFVEVKVA
jgi:hypothetical protein